MELTGLKCNECGTRAFLEDPDTVNWATNVITSPGRRIKVVVHYCTVCADRLFDKFADNTHEKLNTGQRRVIDPGAPNRELEQALSMDTGSSDRQGDLEKLGPPDATLPVPVGAATPAPGVPMPTDAWDPAVASTTQLVRMQPDPPPRRKPDRSGRGRRRGLSTRMAALVPLLPFALPLLALVSHR